MTPKEQAIQDIRKYCSENSKVFIQFVPELDRVMDELVSDYLKVQESLS